MKLKNTIRDVIRAMKVRQARMPKTTAIDIAWWISFLTAAILVFFEAKWPVLAMFSSLLIGVAAGFGLSKHPMAELEMENIIKDKQLEEAYDLIMRCQDELEKYRQDEWIRDIKARNVKQ